jgi:hypothetical protein
MTLSLAMMALSLAMMALSLAMSPEGEGGYR